MLIVSDVDAYCMKCHQMWIDDDEGVTWIQCSVGFLNCVHLMIMTISIVLKVMFLLSNMYDVKRGGRGGG